MALKYAYTQPSGTIALVHAAPKQHLERLFGAEDLTNPGIQPAASDSVVVYPGLTLKGGPVVAIHDSELTRALALTNAAVSTPSGGGTTGKEWWPTNWNYFVLPESVKEALRSDGTAFEVVSDSDIRNGMLLGTNGRPRYPILISLGAEAAFDDELAALTNFVSAGGFLFAGSSAFTRFPDGMNAGQLRNRR